MKNFAILLITALLCGTAHAANNDLPDIGLSASARISSTQEYQIGRAIVRDLMAQGVILEDPELTAYIQSIGSRISIHAHDGNQRFTFFIVDEPSINAFALPGGFIGVHRGLIDATINENELAGVLAHEIAHVSQKHIARMIEASGQANLLTTAAMVAALLIGGLGGGDANMVSAAIAVAQGTAAQQRINFTRDHEYEADRIGIEFLADAGFDPRGMPEFFKIMAQRNGMTGAQIPEFFRTHPLNSNRIAESQSRAQLMPAVDAPSSHSYKLAKARLMVLSEDSISEALSRTRALMDRHPSEVSDDLQYAYSLALVRAGRAEQAIELLEPLIERREVQIAHHILLSQAYLEDGKKDKGLAQFAQAQQLFPRNVPLTMSHSSALLDHGDPDKARKLMLDLVNNVKYTAEQIRILAMAASSAGYNGDAHYYMSEFHVLNGQLDLAEHELKTALRSPDIRDYQFARIETRLQQVQDALQSSRRKNRQRTRSKFTR